MTYHLADAPWEGYRVMVNGSRGRLDREVTGSDHVSPARALNEYVLPTAPGYSATRRPESVAHFRFPDGPAWR